MTRILSPKLQTHFSTATKTRYRPLQHSPVRRSLPRISHATTTNANQATERQALKVILFARVPTGCRRGKTYRSLTLVQNELKKAVAATKRGKKATPQQQTEILNLAEQLEKKNPTSDPALSPLISGRWSLLYIGKPCEQSPRLYCGLISRAPQLFLDPSCLEGFVIVPCQHRESISNSMGYCL